MELIDINILKQYERNAKKHPSKQIEQIANSIKEFGFNQPLVIDKKNIIIVGHGRYLAAKRLGLEKVPIIQVENLNDEQIKAYRLADNKLNESEWDINLAIEELKGLSEEMQGLTGFDLDILTDTSEDGFDAQAEYEKIEEPITKFGDLYQLANHRLLCGDSTLTESYQKLMGDERAQMIFTDPPYNVGYDYTVRYVEGRVRKKRATHEVFDDKKKPENFVNFLKNVFLNCYNFSNKNANFYCWHASKNEYLFRQGIEAANWKIKMTLYWLKNNCTFMMGNDYLYITEPCYYGNKSKKYKRESKIKLSYKNIIMLDVENFEELLNVAYSSRDKIDDYIHPTQKPVRLAERALKKHSGQNDIILEPFNGSGSTMMACEQLKRKCYAQELDPKFCDVAIKRWEQFTNLKAIKL